MIASSELRCSLSFNSRCVSSNSRAFSSATLMLLASVCKSRTSDSVYACSRSVSIRLTIPRTWSPATIGTNTSDFVGSVPGIV